MCLDGGSAVAEIDLERGGRIAELVVHGRPLLFTAGSSSLQWGSYPMVPWAGRVADGRFAFGGRVHRLPLNLPPHAAHGVAFASAWEAIDDRTIATELGRPWPFGGRVEQRFDLSGRGLTITMTVEAVVDMPIMVGWHPWFNRHLGRADGTVAEAELAFSARSMYELDDRSIPNGRLVAVPPGPWDNCFTGVEEGPTLTWPGVLAVRLSSSCDHWVVYDRPGHAICVEPQSGAPDEFNRDPVVLEAGRALEAWFRLDWEAPSREPGGTRSAAAAPAPA
jgi:aldose 1-epimerase